MRTFSNTQSVLFGAAVTLLASLASVMPAQAFDSAEFSCRPSHDYQTNRTVPTTFISSGGDTRPVIRWVKKMGNTSPQQRCDEVSRRLQQAYNNGSLNLIGLGDANGQPAIFSLRETSSGYVTDTMLMTLRHRDDALDMLAYLSDALAGRSVGPMRHSSGQSNPVYKIDLQSAFDSATK